MTTDPDIINLRNRIEDIEARERHYGMHDPTCTSVTEKRCEKPGCLVIHRHEPVCNCWLSDD